MKFLFRYKLFLLVQLCTGSVFAQNVVPDNLERDALIALYNNTNGADWSVPIKWTINRINSYPDSTLYGVEMLNGDIVALSLNGAGLNGTLPAELDELTELRILRIQSNSYSLGELPYLGSLTNLEILDFAGSDLTGTIPSWIGDLVNLEVLNLSSNANTAIKLSGPIPHQIGLLSNLTRLFLSYNDLSQSQSIPDSLSFLHNLAALELQNCQLNFSSVQSGLAGLSSLQTLNLSGNAAMAAPDGTFPDVLYDLPSLRTLSIRNANLRRLPSRFDELPITQLDLGGNNFSDVSRLRDVIDTLLNCPSLKTLLLTLCSIAELPSNVDELMTVENLYLSNNPLLPSDCEVLGGMPLLRNLYLNSCNLTDIPATLVNLQTLEGLYLSNNNLSGVPTTIRDIPALKTLYLVNNGIGDLPSWFGTGNMTSLETLFLDNNQLVVLPENFGGLVNLKYLSIPNNQLTGVWPSNFAALENIETFHLPNNNIDGLPNLSNWTALRSIQLQNNELSGVVPAYLTQATSQKVYVDISGNHYYQVDPDAHFGNTSATVLVQNNEFTFEDLLSLKPSSGSYSYAPQPDSVDIEKEVESLGGGPLTLTAAVDVNTGSSTLYQWFKYVDGLNDQPINPTPTHAARQYTINVTEQDQGNQYYYKITNSTLTGLTLVSRLQTLLIICDILPTNVDFSAKRYLCAMNLIPQVTYPVGCRTKSYSWSFGDGEMSIDKSPLHDYGDDGTYDVTMSIQYTCGVCIRDTTLTKQIVYNLADDVLMESLITVTTETKPDIIAASATTFSDAWPLEHRLSSTRVTGFLTGSNGVWRNEGAFVYQAPRKLSPATNPARFSPWPHE